MTLHPVALPALSFVWQSMGKTPEVSVKTAASARKEPRILLQLTQQKSYLHAGANNARLVKIGENESAFD